MFIKHSADKNKTLPGAQPRTSSLAKNLSRQSFLALMFLEAIAFSALGYFIFVKNARVQLAAAQIALIDQKASFSRILSQYNGFYEIDNLYRQLDTETVKKIPAALPTKPSLSDLMINLETLIKNNGFDMLGVEFQVVDEQGKELLNVRNPSGPDLIDAEADMAGAENITANPLALENFSSRQLNTINITLDVKGNGYLGFKSLITQLENNLRLVDITDFSFNAEDTGFKLTLKSYYFN
jgi:hypothetical protein